jgi:peptide/nickel transport system substrate-binding protein
MDEQVRRAMARREGADEPIVVPITRRQALKRSAAGASFLALPGVLAACGGERGGGNEEAQSGGANDQAEAELKPGGTLVLAVDAITGQSDPGLFSTFGNWMAIDCIARGFTHVDYRTTEPQPALAERWEVSDDGLTYTFFIKKGLTFHDGNPVTAKDAERTFKRLIDEDDPTRPEGVYALAEIGGSNVKSAKAIDDMTFEFKLAKPDVAFLSRMSNPNAVLISAAAIEKHGKEIGRNLVGAGPFKLSDVKSGQSITMERFDDFYMGKPLLDKVVLQVCPDPTALTSALRSGQAQLSPFVPFSNASALKRDSKLVVNEGKPYIVIFAAVNASKPLFKDLRVRQAISYAIDRETIVRQAFNGQATVPSGSSPRPSSATPRSSRPTTRRTSRRPARSSRRPARGRGGRVRQPEHPVLAAIGQIIDRNLKDIGLRPKTLYFDEATYNERSFDPKVHEMSANQRSAFVADPDNKLSPIVAGDSFVTQSVTRNDLLPEQKEFDRMLVEARQEEDEDARKQLYVEVQKYFAEKIAVIHPLAYIALPVTQSKAIGGVNADAMGTYRTFLEKTGYLA